MISKAGGQVPAVSKRRRAGVIDKLTRDTRSTELKSSRCLGTIYGYACLAGEALGLQALGRAYLNPALLLMLACPSNLVSWLRFWRSRASGASGTLAGSVNPS